MVNKFFRKLFFGGRGAAFSFVLSFLILAVFMVQMYGKAYRANGNDFSSYMLSARTFFAGHNPYQTGSHFPFIYPLFLCVILGLFSLMPYWLLNLLWFLGSALALYFVGVILIRQFSTVFRYTDAPAVFIAPFLVLVNVIQNNFLNGQVNFIVLLLCTLFLSAYLRSRSFTASVYLSMAIAIKITPLILIVYLLFRRDFFLVGLVISMTIILGFGLPYIIGGTAIFDYYTSYLHSFLMGSLAAQSQIAHGLSFSLTSIVGFFIPSIPKLFTLIIAGGLSLAPIIFMQFVSRGEKSTEKEILIFSLYMLAILLISPLSETHHLINLLPALSVTVITVLQNSRQYLKIAAVVLIAVIGSLISGKFYSAANLIAIITLYSFMFWLITQNRMRGQANSTATETVRP